MMTKNHLFYTLLAALLILCGVQAKADDLTVNTIKTKPGQTFELSVGLNNTNPNYVGFQMEIILPEGVTPAKTAKGKFIFTPNNDADTGRLDDHSFSANYIEAEHTLGIVCTSMQASTIYGTEGELFKVAFNAAGNMEMNDYQILIQNIKFTTSSTAPEGAKGYALNNVTATLTIGGPHHVVFMDGETVLSDTELEEGEEIVAPQTADKEGMEFVGWQPTLNKGDLMGNEDLLYNAVYNAKSYTLTWIIDGKETTSQVTYGAEITAPANPVKEGYTFTGWTTDGTDVAATMPAQNLTYTAQFTINKYTVKFTDGETVISEKQQDYGTVITAPEAPEKEGYLFQGWSPEFIEGTTVPAGGAFYDAVYALTIAVHDTTYVEVHDTAYVEVHDTTYVEVHDTVFVDVIKEVEVSSLQRVDAPLITINEAGQVVLTCHQTDAEIYYTTNGTEPSESSTRYSAPFEITEGTTIKAIAILRSAVAAQTTNGIGSIESQVSARYFTVGGANSTKNTKGYKIKVITYKDGSQKAIKVKR